MPARIRAATYSWVRASTTTDSMPSWREQVGEQQAGRPGPDDGDVCPHGSLYR